jgi:hypothetical protein
MRRPAKLAERGACVERSAAARVEQQLRAALFQELDLLAYALEMEAAEALAGGAEELALRTQQTRLGVRLAQRLVSGVASPEVDRRLNARRPAYHECFPDRQAAD